MDRGVHPLMAPNQPAVIVPIYTTMPLGATQKPAVRASKDVSSLLQYDIEKLADWESIFEIFTPDYFVQSKRTSEEFIRSLLLPNVGLIKNVVCTELSVNKSDPDAQKFNLYTTGALSSDLTKSLASYYALLQHPYNPLELTKLENNITRIIDSAGRQQSVAVITRQKRLSRIIRKFAQAHCDGVSPSQVVDALLGDYVPKLSVDINAGQIITADSCGKPDRIVDQVKSSKCYSLDGVLKISRPFEFVDKPDHTSRKFGLNYFSTPISLRINSTEEFMRTERTHKVYEVRQAKAFKEQEDLYGIPASRVYEAFQYFAAKHAKRSNS